MIALSQARFLLSVASHGQFPRDEGSEVAFAGRSNAGKSSAINALTQRKALARTSKTPGQTRLLNYFELGPHQRLVDLPGYGYAQVRESERRQWLPLLEVLRERASLAGLMLIVDVRRGLREEDLALIEWADPSRRRVHVLLAKCDKLAQAERAAILRETRATLDARIEPDRRDQVSVQLFSAQDGIGLGEARRELARLLTGAQRRTSD